jgi:hypothetical protein
VVSRESVAVTGVGGSPASGTRTKINVIDVTKVKNVKVPYHEIAQ